MTHYVKKAGIPFECYLDLTYLFTAIVLYMIHGVLFSKCLYHVDNNIMIYIFNE